MKWKILISILLLFPVFIVNAQNPEIGIEVVETMFFGGWTVSSQLNWMTVHIDKGANNLPVRTTRGSGASERDNVWYAAKIRLFYIPNGSTKTINITSFQHANGDLYNTIGSGQLKFSTYGYYWGEVSGNQNGILSPTNQEAFFYLGGVVDLEKDAQPGIYTNESIPVTIGYWLSGN